MAEIWYIPIGAESLEGLEVKYERNFRDSVEILELTPKRWLCGPEEFPQLKTGNPLVDDSGFVYVMMRVSSDELQKYDDENWKPGWYKSSLTIVGMEKNLRKKPK